MKKVDDFSKIIDNNFFKHLNKFSLIPFNLKESRTSFLKKTYDELLSNFTKYKPQKPRKYISSPKSRFVIRMVPTFELSDYCIYYFCVKSLENFIAENRVEGTYGGFRLGGALRRKENIEFEPDVTDSLNDNSFNLLAWRQEYGEYQAALRSLSQKMDNKFFYAIHFDIANFYDCIRLDLLEKKIRNRINNKDLNDEIYLLFRFLKYWNNNYDNEKIVGIPQEELGDCSRILANFFLQDYDQYIYDICQEINANYLRYADDQIIFAKSREDAEKIVFLASQKLFEEGLNINGKTKVFTNYQDFDDIYGFSIFEELKLENPNINKAFELFEMKRDSNNNFRVSSVLKRLLHKSIDLNNLTSRNRIRLLSYLWNEDFLLFSNDHYMMQIYKMLRTNEEKEEFLSTLDEINDNSAFEMYKILLSKFKEKL